MNKQIAILVGKTMFLIPQENILGEVQLVNTEVEKPNSEIKSIEDFEQLKATNGSVFAYNNKGKYDEYKIVNHEQTNSNPTD